MQNWADLLALDDLDIVWIGTPPYMHSAVTVSALEAGKHVFCQARMSMDLAEAEEMLAASKRFPELVTMLCPPPFGLRGDLLVKKLLAEELPRPAASCSSAMFHQRLSESRRAGALAAADRDQRTECSHARHLRRGSAALARRYHRRLCARKNSSPDAPGLRSDRSGFAHDSLHVRERRRRRARVQRHQCTDAR